MVLALHRIEDLRAALLGMFNDPDIKMMYTRSDSYIWQCQKPICNILEKLKGRENIFANSELVIEFKRWFEKQKQAKRRARRAVKRSNSMFSRDCSDLERETLRHSNSAHLRDPVDLANE